MNPMPEDFVELRNTSTRRTTPTTPTPSATRSDDLYGLSFQELVRLSDVLLRDMRPMRRLAFVETFGDRRFKVTWARACGEALKKMNRKETAHALGSAGIDDNKIDCYFLL